MHRFALGIIAAVAVTSLDAGAQVGLVDATRLVAYRPGTWDLRPGETPTPVQRVASDPPGSPVVAPVAAPATHAAARPAGAPRSEPTLARSTAPGRTSPLAPQTAKERRGMKYMFIGGGVLLTGAIVDDDAGDILMVGGLVIVLYGLWTFLN